MKMDNEAEKPNEEDLPCTEEAGDALVVFKVTKLDGTKNESTYECGSIEDLRFKLALKCSTLSPCIILYTKKEQLEVEDATELGKLGPRPITLYYLQSEEDVIPYLAEDWAAEEWLKMLEHHESRGHAGAVERLKPWVLGNPEMKAKMEESYRDLIRTETEELENWGRINIMARLCINAYTTQLSGAKTMFHRALEMNQSAIVHAFVAARVDVDCAQARYAHPLVFAVVNRRVDLVELLLRTGANPNLSHDRFPLYEAASLGDERIVRMLLEAKADANQQDVCGKFALYAAAERGSVSILRLLVDAKAEINMTERTHNYTALYRAARSVDAEPALFLLRQNAHVDAKSSNGHTPLMIAAWRGNADPTLALLLHDADVNAADSDGRIALHHAAESSSPSPNVEHTMRTLMLNGSYMNSAKDKDGNTPLHLAARCGRDKNCTALLDLGSDINATNNLGRRPINDAAATTKKVLRSYEILVE